MVIKSPYLATWLCPKQATPHIQWFISIPPLAKFILRVYHISQFWTHTKKIDCWLGTSKYAYIPSYPIMFGLTLQCFSWSVIGKHFLRMFDQHIRYITSSIKNHYYINIYIYIYLLHVDENPHASLSSLTKIRTGPILWMDKQLHQLETIGNYETRQIMGLSWDKPSANWCRMSSIRSIFGWWFIPYPSLPLDFTMLMFPRVNH